MVVVWNQLAEGAMGYAAIPGALSSVSQIAICSFSVNFAMVILSEVVSRFGSGRGRSIVSAINTIVCLDTFLRRAALPV
ncbi:MAG TPA: hypothetical protein PKO24_06010, partial [Methanomassiliicoccales archaeon]|nr:hypothetical protein [Methanomassiliicoccales archaeon]